MDKLTPERRSANMARVRGKDTGPELRVRKVAHALGLRFRLHRTDLPGTPDLVIPRHRLAVFVHGCFWHRHEGCTRASTPTTRADFWRAKFAATVERDSRAILNLEQLGWRTLVLWECSLKSPAVITSALKGAIDVRPTGLQRSLEPKD